jgi:phosphinothricin acetyltransferase
VIRPATLRDAERICEIYNPDVEGSTATFEEDPVPPEEMRRRIRSLRKEFAWLVDEDGRGIGGYAYFGPWKLRKAYRNSVETTVYVDRERRGEGIGSRLYGVLLDEARRQGRHAVLATIGLANEPSVRLHERFGFVKAAHFREIGHKFGRWIDVGCWELIL